MLTISILPTSPIPSLSSGINPILIPSLMISLGDFCVISSFSNSILPLAICKSPAIPSHSSFCPLPATPATPSISPPRSAKLTFEIASFFSLSSIVTPVIRKSSLPSCASSLLSASSTFFPTIISISVPVSALAVSTVPIVLPFRKTVTLSLISITSFSLCVMIITLVPAAFRFLIIANSLSISLGVSTAVGSSKISILAPRHSTFTISSVCFSPTDISYTFLSSEIFKLYFFKTSSI